MPLPTRPMAGAARKAPGWAPRWALAVAIGLAATGCRRGGADLPEGRPAVVVRAAPDRTIAAGSARVEVAGPTGRGRGRVDFAAGTSRLTWEGDIPDPADPLLAVDLVRGSTRLRPHGGNEVRGVAALRVDVTFDIDRAQAAVPDVRRERFTTVTREFPRRRLEGAVWIDVRGLIRRVQYPDKLKATTPATARGGVPAAVVIDLFDFPQRRE